MMTGRDPIKEQFIDEKLRECYREFENAAGKVNDDVPEFLKGFFKVNFNQMLGGTWEQVWSKNEEWLLRMSRRLGEIAREIAKDSGKDSVDVDVAAKAVDKIRKDPEVCPPDIGPLGGWCSPH